MLIAITSSCSKKKNTVVTAPTIPAQESTTPAQDVLFQTFYWNVTPTGGWWNVIDSKLAEWKSAGITGLWLPVISKGASAGSSMGYDPLDYFDFGAYNQAGYGFTASVPTRFGTEAQLRTLLADAKTDGFKLIADIVINHNGNGTAQWDSISGAYAYTLYTPMSGKFARNYQDFHPSIVDVSDEGVFDNYPDVCHNVPYVKDWLYLQPNSIARYYRDSLGFDGWRFDYASGYSPAVVKSWDSAAPVDYSIGEYNWNATVAQLNGWCITANSGAFDFPLLFAMKSAFNYGDLTQLNNNAGLVSVNPSAAFTFVANHDVDTILTPGKLKAYAFILTSPGTPFIFYTDYESLLSKTSMDSLIWVRKNLAAGTATYLLSNTNEYIFRRNGTPGLVTYINIGTSDAQEKIQTTWANRELKDYVGGNSDATTDSLGYVTITCKANSYAVYSPK